MVTSPLSTGILCKAPVFFLFVPMGFIHHLVPPILETICFLHGFLKRFLPASNEAKSRWWFQTFFIFTLTWGDDPIWRAYFSNGWLNHQLVNPSLNLSFLWFNHSRRFPRTGLTSPPFVKSTEGKIVVPFAPVEPPKSKYESWAKLSRDGLILRRGGLLYYPPWNWHFRTWKWMVGILY